MSATGAETIIVQVDIQANNQRLVELTKQLNENRDALKSLNDANKAGRISSDELAQGQVRLKQSAADIAQETRILTKANQAQDTANKASAGSIEQLRAQLAKGTMAYNALSKAERDTTDAGQKLQASNKALSDELKRVEKAVGDTRRNVGNYKEDILEAAKGMNIFGNSVGEAGGVLGKFKSGSDLVKQGLGLLKGAGETGSLGFKAIAGGIALTGIGLFVIAISAVVTYFTQSAEGGRQLGVILGYLGGVVQVATDAVSAFGKGVVEAFSNPKQALKDFAQLLQDQVLNRFKAFAVIFEAIKRGDLSGLNNGFLQLSTGVVDLTGKVNGFITRLDEAGKLQAGFLDRERAIAALRRQDAKDDEKTQGQIEVLLRLTKQRGVAAADQLAALRQAGQLEREMADGNIALARKELQLVADKRKIKKNAFDQGLIDQQQALELEIIQDDRARKEINARIKVRESVFLQQQRTEAANAAKTAREDAVKAKQTEVEGLLLTVQKGSAAELVLLQRQIQLAADLTLAAGTQTADEKALILATAEGNIAQLQADFNAKALENAKKHDAATVAEANREYAEALTALENYLNQKRALVEADFAAGKIGENEYQKQLNAVDKAGNNAALVNAKDYGKDTGAIEKKISDTSLKDANRVKAEKKKIKDTEQGIQDTAFAATAQISDATIALFGAESQAGQAALAIKKTLALAEIAINLERQLSAIALAGAGISRDIPAPLGPILGTAYVVVNDALAIAGALAGAAKIAGFKQGGYVSGSGTGTSDSIPARLSNGESVMNANSTAMFAPLLSHLNVLGGGVPFAYAAGGLAGQRSGAPVADGGLLARAAGNTLGIDYAALARAMARQPVQVDVRRITYEQGRVATPRSLSTLG